MQFTVLLDESGVQKEKHGVANKAAKLIFACGNNHKSTVDLGYILTLPPAKLREKKKLQSHIQNKWIAFSCFSLKFLKNWVYPY